MSYYHSTTLLCFEGAWAAIKKELETTKASDPTNPIYKYSEGRLNGHVVVKWISDRWFNIRKEGVLVHVFDKLDENCSDENNLYKIIIIGEENHVDEYTNEEEEEYFSDYSPILIVDRIDNSDFKFDFTKDRYEIEFSCKKDVSENDLVNILSCALSDGCAYWCDDFDYSKSEYEEAKSTLRASKENICFEEVLLQMLKEDKTLTLHDAEEDRIYPLTLDKLMRGIGKHISNGATRDIDNWDAEDADCVIQYALFDEIVFS